MKSQLITLCSFAVVLAFLGSIKPAHAELLAYEGFDTISDDGVNLPSLDRTGSSDFGWGDQWRWNGNTGLGITVDSPGLSFGTLDTVGKMATSNFNGSSAGFYRRELSTSYTIGSAAGERTEMWVSWLSTWSGNGPGTGANALQWLKLHNGGTDVISAGINNWGGVRGTDQEDQWRLSPPGADSFTGVVAEPGQTYLLAMRLSAQGDDTLIELFVNANGDPVLASALATHTVSGTVTFNQVRLQTEQTNITAQWDEIRLGNSAEDVGFVAEPGQSLIWQGEVAGGIWDLDNTAHWQDSEGEPAVFQILDDVTFDDSAATGSVMLSEPEEGLTPFGITIANDTLEYILEGGVLTGGAALIKNGAADVTLLAENNLGGGISIAAGTLRIGNGGLQGSAGAGAIANQGSLVIERDGLLAISGGISGSGTLEVAGPGTTILSGTNSYTGTTTISGGTLRTTGTLDSPIVVQSGATLAPGPASGVGTLSVANLTLESGSRTAFRVGFADSDSIEISTPGGLQTGSPHFIDLSPTEEWLPGDRFTLFSYDTTFSGDLGDFQIGAAPHGTYTFSENATFGEIQVTVDSLDSLVWKGGVNSEWDIDQTANWELVSDGSQVNFFAYDQVLFDGSGANTSVSVPEQVTVGDMRFDFDDSVSYLLSGPGSVDRVGVFEKAGSGTLTMAVDVTGGDGQFIDILGGSVVIGDGGTTGSLGGGTIFNEGSLVFNRDGQLSVANPIQGPGALRAEGPGTVTLGGANTFSGDVTVGAGTLVLANAAALGSSFEGEKTVTIEAGAQIDLNNFRTSNPASTYSFSIAGDGDGTGALINNAGVSIGSWAGIINLELAANASVGGTARYDLGLAAGVGPGVITGNGHTLTKIGPNQINLRGPASDLSVVVSEGILGIEDTGEALGGATGSVSVAEDAVLGAFGEPVIATPVTLEAGAILRALGDGVAEWSGPVTLAGDATIDTPAVGMTVSGVIGGGGGLTKTGGNTLTLSAANTYQGPTTVSDGTLILTEPSLADTAAVTVAGGAVLNLDFSGVNLVGALTLDGTAAAPGTYDASTHPGLLGGTGALQVAGSGSDYDDWAASFGLVGGPDDDDSGDGLSNFHKYAFGLDPTDPSSLSPVSTPDPGTGTFTYTRRKPSLTGLVYTHESSTTLAAWTAFTPVSETSDAGDPVETITVTLPASLPAEPKLFLRVEAVQP